MTYLEWNDQIAKHFFNSKKSGIRVWFSVEQELIDDIAQKKGVNFDGFIEAVKKGPDWVYRNQQKICIKAYDAFKKWDRRSEYPPYIAYLALFVLAVNHGNSEDFFENAYYGRLKTMLKEKPVMGQYPSFQKMWELWIDLEKWSLEDKKGELGEFHFDIYGKNNHVGIPYYQVVLKTEDKQNLSDIFWKMGWDSDSNPTEMEILKALKNNENLLSNRTIRRIKKGKADFLSVLTDRVLEELREYDADEQPVEDKDKESTKRGTIEICLDIDETAQKTDFYFRCKRKAGLPEESFMIKSNGSEWKVVPSSSSVSQKITGFNIENLDKDFSFGSRKYKFHYKGEKYKIFTQADRLGARDWISGQRPLPGKLFYLAAHNSLADKIQKWGQSACDICDNLDFNGLPREWSLFKVKGINGDKGIKQDIPAVSIDERLRIKFEGGIRSKRKNQFFDFAPPKILITGGTGQIPTPVYQRNQNDVLLAPISGEENIFDLPDNIPCGENIKIKIKSTGSEFESQRNLRLVENRLEKFSEYSNGAKMDHFGKLKQPLKENSDEPFQSEKLYFKGAYCHGFKSKSTYPKLPQVSLDSIKTIYLIGNTPGQIVVWPTDSLPESWSPIWMIQFKTYKKATACLIGNIKEINSGEQGFSKEQIKLWKKIVWHKRKRIKSKPKKQWKSWTKRAKNV